MLINQQIYIKLAIFAMSLENDARMDIREAVG